MNLPRLRNACLALALAICPLAAPEQDALDFTRIADLATSDPTAALTLIDQR